MGAAFESSFLGDTPFGWFLRFRYDEVEVPFFRDFVSEPVDFWEFAVCVDVDCWEDVAIQGFSAQPKC